MQPVIPFSEVSNIIPSVLSAGGSAVDLNAIMLTQSPYAPYGQVLEFASATDVGSYFGATSTEALMATIYFNGYSIGTKQPGLLMMAQYPEAAIAGFLRSSSLASMTLVQLQALSGTLSITVAGTVFTSTTITLSSAISFSNAATIIQAAFTSPTFTVTFDSVHSAFIVTTTTTGSTETITYATGTLSAELYLTQATGAVLSQGAPAAVPAAFMAGILTQTQNWATFMALWTQTLSEKEAFATWSNSVAPRYLYVAHDSDVNAKTANSSITFGNFLQVGMLVGTMPIYSNIGDFSLAAFACGIAASLDFTRLNGRSTLCFKAQSGLLPSITNATDYAAIKSNGYNCYGAFGSNNPANNSNWLTPGTVSGSWNWADTYLNQIWLNANMQLAAVKLLQAIGSIPYNAQGYGLAYAAWMDPIKAASNFGAIRKGVVLSNAQIAEIQYMLGFDASASITATGFYLQIVPAPASVRSARQSPPCILYYQDGESIQQLNLASIAIQ